MCLKHLNSDCPIYTVNMLVWWTLCWQLLRCTSNSYGFGRTAYYSNAATICAVPAARTQKTKKNQKQKKGPHRADGLPNIGECSSICTSADFSSPQTWLLLRISLKIKKSKEKPSLRRALHWNMCWGCSVSAKCRYQLHFFFVNFNEILEMATMSEGTELEDVLWLQ